MDPVNILEVGQFRIEEDYIFNIFKTFFDELVPGVEQAFFPFGVGWADAPVKGQERGSGPFCARRGA